MYYGRSLDGEVRLRSDLRRQDVSPSAREKEHPDAGDVAVASEVPLADRLATSVYVGHLVQ